MRACLLSGCWLVLAFALACSRATTRVAPPPPPPPKPTAPIAQPTPPPPPSEAEREIMRLEARCAEDQADACVEAHELLIASDLPRAEARELAVIERACKLGEEFACVDLASNYDLASDHRARRHKATTCYQMRRRARCTYRRVEFSRGPDGWAFDPPLEVCDNAPGVCRVLAADPYTPPELVGALYQHACDGGDAIACAGAATAYRAAGDSRALAVFERACELRHAASCFDAAVLHRGLRPSRRDMARVRALYQEACDGAVARACTELERLRASGLPAH